MTESGHYTSELIKPSKKCLQNSLAGQNLGGAPVKRNIYHWLVNSKRNTLPWIGRIGL
jgi:hypothetical protein